MYPFQSYTLEWWQVGILKLSMIALGMAVGATWPAVLQGWVTLLWFFFVVTAIYMTFVAIRHSGPRSGIV